jgi:hypothetical protein
VQQLSAILRHAVLRKLIDFSEILIALKLEAVSTTEMYAK